MEIYSFNQSQPVLKQHKNIANFKRSYKPSIKTNGKKRFKQEKTETYTPSLSLPSFDYYNGSATVASFAASQTKQNTTIFSILQNSVEFIKNRTFKITLILAIFSIFSLIVYLGMQAAEYLDNVEYFFSKPVNLQISEQADNQILNDAMNNFIFSHTEEVFFDENGNILSAIPQEFTYTEPVTFKNYVVKPNDSVSVICQKFGLTNVSTLIAVNNISNAKRLQAGKSLVVPSLDGMFYIVQKGDSIEKIAKNYNISIEQLIDVNDLESSVLTSGQRLFVPGAKLQGDELKRALGELFIYPVKDTWRLTSRFGKRADPFTGVASYHTGIDMAAPLKTPIYASGDGTVSLVRSNSVFGNYVVITHAGGYQTLYAHLYSASVKQGQKVKQGAKIGLMGSTGYSTGSHLHFTVYKNGKLIDPFEILK